jgi:hypothetical protein
MKQPGLLLLPGLLFLPGCIPSEVATGLPTVGCNQLGTPPVVTTALRANVSANSELAGKVYFVGRSIAAKNVNFGLDPNVVFITYPSPAMEIFHVGRTQVYVTEGLARKCDSDQLAGVLAWELGKMAAERIVASPYLDARDIQGPVHLEAGKDNSTETSETVELVHWEGQTRTHKEVRPDPRQLAQTFLEKADYTRGCLVAAQPLLDEASLNHHVERSVKGLPSRPKWTPE